MNDVEECAQFIDFVQLSSQRAGQVEAEAIDVQMRLPSSVTSP